ncbi:MAG: hypothetical protein PHX21_03155 [bacterium]|nr:hypothetical protein [bacterium]
MLNIMYLMLGLFAILLAVFNWNPFHKKPRNKISRITTGMAGITILCAPLFLRKFPGYSFLLLLLGYTFFIIEDVFRDWE